MPNNFLFFWLGGMTHVPCTLVSLSFMLLVICSFRPSCIDESHFPTLFSFFVVLELPRFTPTTPTFYPQYLKDLISNSCPNTKSRIISKKEKKKRVFLGTNLSKESISSADSSKNI